MARINVEDDIEARDEFRRLVKLLGGDDDRARGMLVRFWRLAQKAYGKKETVPLQTLELSDMAQIIQSGWAIKQVDGGYQALGADKQFGWYRQKIEASKRGGESNKSRTAIARLSAGSSPDSPLTLTPTLTKILKEELKDEKPKTEKPALKGVAIAPPVSSTDLVIKKPEKGENAEAARQFIATYVRAYQSRHGPNARPECLSDGKTIGLVRGFLKNRPIDRACDLIQVYLQMEDPWFLKNHHDIVTFTQKINQIGLALQNGRDPTKPMTFLEYMERKANDGTQGIQCTN